LNYVVIRIPMASSFPVLLGRPWLYKARVCEDWKKEFRIDNRRIPWRLPKYQGESGQSTDPYTTDEGEESESSTMDCWMVVNAFKAVSEEDVGLYEPDKVDIELEEVAVVVDNAEEAESQPELEEAEEVFGVEKPVARPVEPVQEPVGQTSEPVAKIPKQVKILTRGNKESILGKLSTTATQQWVQKTTGKDPELQKVEGLFSRGDEEPDNAVVKPMEYEKLSIDDEHHFYIGKGMPPDEKVELQALLNEFCDVFAWSHTDLTGIDPKYGTHRIDLKEDARPV